MRSFSLPRSMAHFIVQDLGAAIVTGKYSAEPFPTENDLCLKYSASRTVLREAVKMLTSKGLLSARQRRGTEVNPEDSWSLFDPDVLRWLLQRTSSPDLLIEVTQIRLGIEPMAAYLAARNASSRERAEIAKALERIAAAKAAHGDMLPAVVEFHVAVLQASGNRFCRQLQELVETALPSNLSAANGGDGAGLASVEGHRVVADAIFERDCLKAEWAMRAILQDNLDRMIAIKLKRNGQVATGTIEAPAPE